MLLVLSRSGGGCFGGLFFGGCEKIIPVESMSFQIVFSDVGMFVDSFLGKVTAGSSVDETSDSVAVGTGFVGWRMILVGEMVGSLVGYSIGRLVGNFMGW